MDHEVTKHDHDEQDDVPPNPFAPFQMMETLLEKLKLLDYEQNYCRRMRLKGFSRVQFAIPTNPGEQFNVFVSLAAWLIGQAGGNIEAPQEYDDPNATIANVLESLHMLGHSTEFPPSKLKSGCGEPCIRVLDLLAGAAVKHRKLRFDLPDITNEAIDDPETIQETSSHSEDDDDLVEWTEYKSKENVTKHEATGIIYDSDVADAEVLDDDEAVLDLEGPSGMQPKLDAHFRDSAMSEETLMDTHGPMGSLANQSHGSKKQNDTKSAGILEPTIDREDWLLEVERVLPQLRVAIRTDSKDWRSHLEQMARHRSEIDTCFKESKGHLQRLFDELTKGLDKINSREKYMNTQVDKLLTEYRCAQDRLCEMKERYTQASGGITERSKLLADLTDELDLVKQEMDQRGSSMTDGSPVLRIKQAIQRLKAENVAMEIRTGVLEHTLLRMHLRAREESQRPLFTRYTVGAAQESEFVF